MLSQREKVNRYYQASIFDYHTMWTGKEDQAIHFGYYDSPNDSHSQSLLNMNRVLAQCARVTSVDRVVDAGCGYGGSAVWLAKNIGCTVIGLNIVPFQIKKAEQCARREKVTDRVSFRNEDYTQTSLLSMSVDVVWGLESIVHAPDKAQFVKEAFRVLKFGGRIVMAEYTLRENPPLSEREIDFLRVWLDGWAMPNLLEAGVYKKLFGKAGFKNIKAENITPQVLPSFQRLKRLLRWGLPVGRFLNRVGIFSAEHIGNIEGSRVHIEALEKGYWQYSILTAEKNNQL